MTDWPEIFPRENDPRVNKKEQEEYPVIFQCGAPGCHWRTAHRDVEHARKVKSEHKCGQQNRVTPQNVNKESELSVIIVKLWAHLDEATRVVMDQVAKRKNDEHVDETVFNEARGNARGLAVAIFEMSVPGYDTADAVAKHAVARYKAKMSKEELPPTVGIDGYNPHLDAERSKSRVAAPKAKAKPVQAVATVENGSAIRNKKGKVLDDSDIDGIQNGLKAGLPVSSLAQVYKLTEEQILAIKDMAKS